MTRRRQSILAFAIAVMLASRWAWAERKGGQAKLGLDSSSLPADARVLRSGEAAPDFSLPGIDGKTYSLASFKNARLLMVVFLSNHCPYSHAAERRLIPFSEKMKSRGLAVVAINPNHPDAVRIDELGYSKYNDSFEEMKVYAKEAGIAFPYLYDGEKQSTAKGYGCIATPHVFLFDEQRRLRYSGRFDDSRFADPATVKSADAENAVAALLEGKPVPVETTKPMGCSTKWLSAKSEIAAVQQQWDEAPVTVETLGKSELQALAKNDSNKLRLFTVWATWCAPCVQEFPGFVALARRLGNRDFEMITISADDAHDAPKVQKFLQQQHAAVPNRVQRSLKREGRKTNNYIYNGGNLEELMQTIDPSAPGPVPFTAVIAPGGKVVYRRAGPVDFNELKSKLIDELGPYYD